MAVAKSDLQRAYEALAAKQEPYSLLFDYYDGKAPLRYVTDRLREVFQFKEARFTLNWAAVVADAELERIRLNEFTIATPEPAAPEPPTQPATVEVNPLQTLLNDLWERTELKLDADDVHTATKVCGEAFVVVWKDDGTEAVEAYYNDPRLCHVFYDDENPRVKSFACKWWMGADGRRYLNLYYPDRIDYYASKGKSENVSNYRAFEPTGDGTADNPFGIVPVFHFRNERRVIKSALANVIEPQDAVNKLMADMMVAAEFGAFKQRYIITNADLGTLKNAPNEIWEIPAGDGEGQASSAGEFSATELGNYLAAMDKLATSIAIITRTPKHYFLAQGGDPSGEALIAMEAPLNKKAQTTIDRLTPVWAQVASFMLTLAGADVSAEQIVPAFERPETVQPKTQAEIQQISTSAGMPLVTVLRRQGWTEEELAQLAEDQQKQDALTPDDLDAAMRAVEDLMPQPQPAGIGANGANDNGSRPS